MTNISVHFHSLYGGNQKGSKKPACVIPTFSKVCGENNASPKVNDGLVGRDCRAHSHTDVVINVRVAVEPHSQDGVSLLYCMYHQ